MLESLVSSTKANTADKTTSLLFLDGSDDMASSTKIIDAANTSRLWTLTSGSTMTTEVVKFGTKSFKVNGGYGLITPHDSTMIQGSEYTVEMFVNIWDYSVVNFFMTKTAPDKQHPYIRQYGNLMSPDIGFDGGTGGSGDSSSTFVKGNWAHVALSVVGNSKKLFLNGVLVRNENNILTWGKNAYPFIIGANGRRGSSDTQGRFYAQAFRISKVARYSNNFIPPTARFELD